MWCVQPQCPCLQRACVAPASLDDLDTVALTEQHKQKQVFVNICVRRITGARKKVSHCLVVLQSVQCLVLAATKISIIVFSKLIAPCLPNNVKHLEKRERDCFRRGIKFVRHFI